MKGLVIGNSHAAQLFTAYKELTQQIDFNLDFFAAPGGDGPNLVLCQDLLSLQFKHKTKRSRECFKSSVTDNPDCIIRIEDYDFVLLSGVGGGPPRTSSFRRKHSIDLVENNAIITGICDWSPQSTLQLISKTVYLSILENRIRIAPSCVNVSIVGSVCKKLHKKLFVQMSPLPTSCLLGQEHFGMHHYGADVGKFLSWRYSHQSRLIREIYSDTTFNILEYEKEWIHNGYTPDEFAGRDAWHPRKVHRWFLLNRLNQVNN